MTILLSQSVAFGARSNSFENIVYAQELEFLEYTNPEFGYQIKYPSSWSKMELGDPTIHAIITAPFESNKDEFSEIVFLGGEKLFLEIDLDAYTELSIQGLQTPTFKMIDSKKTTLSGKPAQIIEFSEKNEFGQDVTAMAVWTVDSKNAYLVMLFAETSSYSSYLPIFEKMLDSYTIENELKEEPKLEISFEDYTTHIDSVNKIKFQYPVEWSKVDLDSGPIHYIISSPFENYYDEYSETIVFGTEEIPFGLLNLDTYSKMSIQNIESLPDYKFIEDGDTTLAGLPAHQLIYTQVEPNYNIKIKSLTVWTIKNDKAYIVGFGAEPEKYSAYLPTFEKIISSFEIGQFELPTTSIPDWIRNNAKWWVEGNIDDTAFVGGIQFLIKNGIIQIPETTETTSTKETQEIPSWIKNNADWWSKGLISDDDFLKGIQFMVENGIIRV